MGEFSPPFFTAPFVLFFSYPSNIEIIFDFSDVITKIHPLFQNPGSALASCNQPGGLTAYLSALLSVLI